MPSVEWYPGLICGPVAITESVIFLRGAGGQDRYATFSRSEQAIRQSNQQRSENPGASEFWPAPFWFTGRFVFLLIVSIVALMWIAFILHDLVRVFGPVDFPMWVSLFGDSRPIEWLQWFLLVIITVLAGFLSGKLTGRPARFFLLIAFSAALIFVEDSSDLRYMLYLEYSSAAFGSEIAGWGTRIVSDLTFSLAIMILPAYTLIRYGGAISHFSVPRNFMLAGFGLYALAAVLSALRHVDGFYHDLGVRIDAWLMFGRWPSSLHVPPDMTYFHVVDAFLKENLEVLGAACFLGMVLSYAWLHRNAPNRPPAPGIDASPGLLRVDGRTAFLAIASFVAVTWLLVLVFDLIQIIGPLDRPVWEQVFHNNRPAEWVQWSTLLIGAVLSANLAARLHGDAARFFFVMAFALALIFFEDASDLRHMFFYEYWTPRFGDDISGIPTRVVSDSIYFGAIALVPIFAVLRYWLAVWPVESTRRYLVTGFIFFALAGGLSAIRHLGDLYINIGAWMDANLFASRWPYPDWMSEDRAHFYVMDSFMEETFETLGAACLLAMVLSFASYWRTSRESSASPPPDPPR